MNPIHRIVVLLKIFWASPWSAVGLFLGGLGVCTGGHVRRRGRTLEFYGGVVPRLLRCLPGGAWVAAITFGHTVLGVSPAALDFCRDHEWVHVRQYERWGPFFGPAYLMASLIAWLQGKRPYRDNRFEREAYGDE